MKAEPMMLGAGAISFAGSFKEAGGFPPNGWGILGGTIALAFLFSITSNTVLSGPAKGLAALMLLASVYRYAPGLVNRKGK